MSFNLILKAYKNKTQKMGKKFADMKKKNPEKYIKIMKRQNERIKDYNKKMRIYRINKNKLKKEKEPILENININGEYIINTRKLKDVPPSVRKLLKLNTQGDKFTTKLYGIKNNSFKILSIRKNGVDKFGFNRAYNHIEQGYRKMYSLENNIFGPYKCSKCSENIDINTSVLAHICPAENCGIFSEVNLCVVCKKCEVDNGWLELGKENIKIYLSYLKNIIESEFEKEHNTLAWNQAFRNYRHYSKIC